MLIEMKKVVLFFAVVASVAVFASCGPRPAADSSANDSIVTVVDTPAVVTVDTPAVTVDTPAVAETPVQ